MIEVLSNPEALSMVGSMAPFEIFCDSKADVVFALKYKNADHNIVQHTYTPNENKRVTIKVKDIILPLLSFEVKDSSQPYIQQGILKDFEASVYEVGSEASKKTIYFSVIRAGVDRLSDSAENFLKTNFLTWQPQQKPVTYYSPDYTITPLTVQPNLNAIDPDELLVGGRINAALTNIVWTEIEAGVEKTIDVSNKQYDLVLTGDNAGRILVKRNASPGYPLTLRFDADFLDTRLSQVSHFTMTYLIKCKNATLSQPVVLLDTSDVSFYNPLRDVDEQTISAKLLLGSQVCPEANRQFVWEVLRKSGTFSQWGKDELDLEARVSEDGTSFTVNRSLMGDRITIRCRAKYSVDGKPSSVELTEFTPSKIVSIVRRIPKFEADWVDVPMNLPGGQQQIYPRTKITDNIGVLENPTTDLLPLYYMAPNPSKASGVPSYSLVGHGMEPTISTENMSKDTGGIMGLDVKILDPLAILVDGSGAVIVDGDGAAIVFH